MCTHNLCFEQKYENSKKYSIENCHFYSHVNGCMLHGRVFIMYRNKISEIEIYEPRREKTGFWHM